MPPPVRIRPARPGDLPTLVAIEALFPSDRMPHRQFRHQLVRGKGRLRVASAGGRVLGYALTMFRAGTRVARLYSIAVHPDARGNGIGAALLDDAERGARRRGCTRMRLEVRVRNRAAIAMYEARGYVRFARRVDYYEDGTDAFRFQKLLGAGAADAAGPGPRRTPPRRGRSSAR